MSLPDGDRLNPEYDINPIEIKRLRDRITELEMLPIDESEELKFLRFFYQEAADAMGPADADIYYMIKQAYEDGGGILPKEYKVDYDEEELEYVSEITYDGDQKIKRWKDAIAHKESCKRALSMADTELMNAANDLQKWLTPTDYKINEKFCIAYGKEFIQVEVVDQYHFNLTVRPRAVK